MQALIETDNRVKPGGATRPLVSPSFASAILDCSRYILLEEIENQHIPLAFNIAAPGAQRMCLRVASANVMAFKLGLKPQSDLAKFFEGALPKEKAIYGPPKLAWLLHCDNDHIYHLLAAGEFADAGNKTRYLIPRESVINFLTKRRLS